MIRSHLFQLPVPLENPAAIKDWALSVEPRREASAWVLTCTPPRADVSYRLTIDAARGNCIRTIECIGPDGRLKHYDVELALADYGDGRWYVSGALRTDYDPKDPSKRRATLRMTVREATFDVDVDDRLFELEFGEGTRVEDAATRRRSGVQQGSPAATVVELPTATDEHHGHE